MSGGLPVCGLLGEGLLWTDYQFVDCGMRGLLWADYQFVDCGVRDYCGRTTSLWAGVRDYTARNEELLFERQMRDGRLGGLLVDVLLYDGLRGKLRQVK